ncbi:MAG: amino acid permease [Bacteroidetes bacterium]|nr:amino acid permease [Bacteroidota bacterium]MCW5896645.1 amino acid permease [Bacteroidota bacterium]
MPQLKQALTRFDLTMIAIGSTIGSGIFLTPSLIAHELQTPWLILAVWVVGGLMAVAGALTFAELGGLMPGAGGVYVYLSEAYGGIFGFLYGWAYLLVVNTGGVAALSIAFATYFGYFVPLDPMQLKVAAICGLAIVTIVNVLGVKVGGIFSDIFTLLKMAGILLLIIVGLGWGSSSTTDFSASIGSFTNGLGSALAVAMVGVLWSYGGWQHASFAAAEAKDPKRTVPFAMVVGALTVTVIYLLTNVAYMFLLPIDAIGSSERVAADAIGKVLGPEGAGIIAIAIFISTFGTAGIYTLTAPRIYFAMANDGVFFKKVAEVHPRYQTPAVAILIQSIWAAILILFWGTFNELISYVVFTDWIFFGLAAASVFIFRRTRPNAERPYRTFGYPVTPLFFIALAAWFVFNTFIEKPEQAIAGLGFLALGIPVYYFWRRQNSSAA